MGFREDFFILLCHQPTKRAMMWGGEVKNENERLSMEHINRIELKGRVGTVRSNTHNENKVVNFTLVTEFFFKNRNGEPMSETTWFNVVAWDGKDINDLDRIEKGVAVHISGRMRTTKYTNAEGIEKQFYEVLATKLKVVEDEMEPAI